MYLPMELFNLSGTADISIGNSEEDMIGANATAKCTVTELGNVIIHNGASEVVTDLIDSAINALNQLKANIEDSKESDDE